MGSVCELVVATATVKNGRLRILNRKAFDASVSELRDGWQVEITIKRLRATRSLEQNAYYWGVVVQLLAEHTGYSPEDIHELLKAKFIPKRLAVCDGNGVIHGEFVLGGSTRQMNKIEFGEYMDGIREWAADSLGVVIPDPNQDAEPSHAKADVASTPTWYRAKRRTA